MYLLDTNTVSNILRNPQGVAAARLQKTTDGDVVVSIIVACELRFGICKRNAPALEKLVDGFLQRTPVLPFDLPADKIYGIIRADLEAAGTPIGSNDIFIAAHALALDAILVTDNEREFSRINGLKVENWLR